MSPSIKGNVDVADAEAGDLTNDPVPSACVLVLNFSQGVRDSNVSLFFNAPSEMINEDALRCVFLRCSRRKIKWLNPWPNWNEPIPPPPHTHALGCAITATTDDQSTVEGAVLNRETKTKLFCLANFTIFHLNCIFKSCGEIGTQITLEFLMIIHHGFCLIHLER